MPLLGTGNSVGTALDATRRGCRWALLGAAFSFACRGAKPASALQQCNVESAPVVAPAHSTNGYENVEECAYPPETDGIESRRPRELLRDRALETPQQPGALLTVCSYPSFVPARSLSLRKASTGDYVLRSIRLRAANLPEIRVQLEAVGDEPFEVALPELDDIREVHERILDPRTAELLLSVLKAQAARGARTDSTLEEVFKTDGITYRVWQDSSTFEMHSPTGSLGLAAAALDRLARIVNQPGADDCVQLATARQELLGALAGAARPCQRLAK